MRTQLNREIATDSFTYGNHEIRIQIRLRHTTAHMHAGNDIMNGVGGSHFYRIISVEAHHPVEGREVEKETYAAVDVEPRTKWLPLIGEIEVGSTVPSIPDQVEYTVRPVLHELNEFYEITSADVDVDVDVAVERVEHEISWVEVDDEVDRISAEIESMVEKDSD